MFIDKNNSSSLLKGFLYLSRNYNLELFLFKRIKRPNNFILIKQL